MAIFFTIFTLSLFVNIYQYLDIKNMEEREVRLNKLLDKWQHKVESYQERLLPQDTL